MSCLLQIEDIGFCKRGEGAAFIRQMGIGIEGRLPINTHGGLLAHSYLLGVEHVVEAVRQLRGEAGPRQVRDAEIGLVGGLSNPDYGVLLLGRETAMTALAPEFAPFLCACPPRGACAFPNAGVRTGSTGIRCRAARTVAARAGNGGAFRGAGEIHSFTGCVHAFDRSRRRCAAL